MTSTAAPSNPTSVRPFQKKRLLSGPVIALLAFAGMVAVGVLTFSVVAVMYLSDSRTREVAEQNIAEIDPELDSVLRAMRVTASSGDWPGFCRYVNLPSMRSSIRELCLTGIRRNHAQGQASELEAAMQATLAIFAVNALVDDQWIPALMQAVTILMGARLESQSPNLQRTTYFEGKDIYVSGAHDPSTGAEFYLVYRKDRADGWQLSAVADHKP